MNTNTVVPFRFHPPTDSAVSPVLGALATTDSWYKFGENGWSVADPDDAGLATFSKDVLSIKLIKHLTDDSNFFENNFSAYDKNHIKDICVGQVYQVIKGMIPSATMESSGLTVSFRSGKAFGIASGYTFDPMTEKWNFDGVIKSHSELMCELSRSDIMTHGLCDFLKKNNIPCMGINNEMANGAITPIRSYTLSENKKKWIVSGISNPHMKFHVDYVELLAQMSYHTTVSSSISVFSLVHPLRYFTMVDDPVSGRPPNRSDSESADESSSESSSDTSTEETSQMDNSESESTTENSGSDSGSDSGSGSGSGSGTKLKISKSNSGLNCIVDSNGFIYESVPKPPVAKITFRKSDEIHMSFIQEYFVERGCIVQKYLYDNKYIPVTLGTNLMIELFTNNIKGEFHIIETLGKKDRIKFPSGTKCICIKTGLACTLGSAYH